MNTAAAACKQGIILERLWTAVLLRYSIRSREARKLTKRPTTGQNSIEKAVRGKKKLQYRDPRDPYVIRQKSKKKIKIDPTFFLENGLRKNQIRINHTPNVRCHALPICSVSISSMPCRAITLRVHASLPCLSHLVRCVI